MFAMRWTPGEDCCDQGLVPGNGMWDKPEIAFLHQKRKNHGCLFGHSVLLNHQPHPENPTRASTRTGVMGLGDGSRMQKQRSRLGSEQLQNSKGK